MTTAAAPSSLHPATASLLKIKDRSVMMALLHPWLSESLLCASSNDTADESHCDIRGAPCEAFSGANDELRHFDEGAIQTDENAALENRNGLLD